MKKLTAKKITKLKRKIKRWHVWKSESQFGFMCLNDPMIYNIGDIKKAKPDFMVYGLDIFDAVDRYNKFHPHYAFEIYGQCTPKWAVIGVLPYGSKDKREVKFYS